METYKKTDLKYFAAIVFIIIATYSLYTFAYVSGQLQQPVKSDLHEPGKIVEMFFQAVDRGELIVFEQKLEKSMLIPVRVKYIYELNGSSPAVSIYSELKKQITIPSLDGVQLRAVSTKIDHSGNITEIKAHVFPR